MISSFKAIFIAIRFKTLIASIAPVVLSSSLSFHYGAFNFIIFSFILLSALFIQIGTNFANDVYDYLKGADTKDRTPAEGIANSDPETVKVTLSPSSSSVAVTVSIAVWFSAALKVALEVKTGATSLTLVIAMVTSLVTVSVPSVKDKVIPYEVLVS